MTPSATPATTRPARTTPRATPARPAARALLFDMDGTLVDSTRAVERTWRSFARRHGLDDDTVLGFAHGRRTEETVRAFLPPGTDPDDETRRVVAGEVEDTDGIVPVAGAPELLAGLPAGRWGVVTSASRALAERRTAAAGLTLPPVVVGSEEVSAGKPDPEGYRAASARLGVDPSETVVFEDAEAGVLAARACGARTVVVGGLRSVHGDGLERVRDLTAIRIHVLPDGGLDVTIENQ